MMSKQVRLAMALMMDLMGGIEVKRPYEYAPVPEREKKERDRSNRKKSKSRRTR